MYTERERRIFGPLDRGDGQEIYIDPIAALRALNEALGGDLNAAIEAYNDDSPEADPLDHYKAEGRLVKAARSAFGLADFDPFSGRGAKDAEVLDDLRNFLDYLEKNG